MQPGITFTVRWHDEVEDLLQVLVFASNGVFAGEADVYTSAAELLEAARKLQGFPSHPAETHEFTFGTFGSESAGGAVAMRLSCKDRSGHLCADLKIESDQVDSEHGAASFRVPIEPAALDRFTDQLRSLGIQKEGSAYLSAAS